MFSWKSVPSRLSLCPILNFLYQTIIAFHSARGSEHSVVPGIVSGKLSAACRAEFSR